MKEFFSSPTFLLSAIGLVAFGVVIALLWRNTVWEARGITPAPDVERLRKRITGLFPKSIAVWCVIAAVIILVAIGLRGLSGTSSTHSESGTWLSSLQSPSLATVAAVTQSYWLWIFIVGIIAWVYLSFIQKENETLAKTLKATVGGVVLILFVVVPAGFWVRDAFLPQVICKDVSAHETRNCVLNTAWSTWVKAAERTDCRWDAGLLHPRWAIRTCRNERHRFLSLQGG